MIISYENKFVYIAIPKTGSASIRSWCKRYGGLKTKIPYHSYIVPDQYRDYSIFTTVRNPYERCWSWYNFEGKTYESFIKYMEDLILWKNDGYSYREFPQQYITQTEYIKRGNVDYVIKLEELDMEVLPFINEKTVIPHSRKTKNKPKGSALKYLKNSEKKLVQEYCLEDFEELGYEL